MQFSCYHYHSNRCAWNYAFIRDSDRFLIRVAKKLEMGEEDGGDMKEFLIGESTLEANDILYSAYKLSILLTKDVNKLEHIAGEGWAISTRVNWKGSYLGKDFQPSHYWEEYPTVLEEPENNSSNFQSFLCDRHKQHISSFRAAEQMVGIR